MRVLIAPDKFKGTLTAREVAAAIGAGLAAAGVPSIRLPLADGGDGSVTAAVAAGFSPHPVTVTGADGQSVEATFAYDEGTAIVEVAGTCGLATLPDGVLTPMTSSSYGFGQAVRAALDAGARRIVLALGGSAGTDGGAGMLAALGMRFLDRNGALVRPTGNNLGKIVDLDATGLVDLTGVELVMATDVDSPLLHESGTATVFGPQKGATPLQVLHLEAALHHLVRLLETVETRTGGLVAQLADEPGTGAAGGLGLGCRWLGAHRVTGADHFLNLLGFDDHLARCDAVITGEGRIDNQSLAGKLPSMVAAHAGTRDVHVLVGRNDLTAEEEQQLKLTSITALTDMTRRAPQHDTALSTDLLYSAAAKLGHELRDHAAVSEREKHRNGRETDKAE